MYKGQIGFMKYIGDFETDDVRDMNHKLFTHEIDYYEEIK